jgi:hypothetical protein
MFCCMLGYYADPASQCQAFHVCVPDGLGGLGTHCPSSAPTAPSSTRSTSSAIGGSTSTALRPLAFTAATTRSPGRGRPPLWPPLPTRGTLTARLLSPSGLLPLSPLTTTTPSPPRPLMALAGDKHPPFSPFPHVPSLILQPSPLL